VMASVTLTSSPVSFCTATQRMLSSCFLTAASSSAMGSETWI